MVFSFAFPPCYYAITKNGDLIAPFNPSMQIEGEEATRRNERSISAACEDRQSFGEGACLTDNDNHLRGGALGTFANLERHLLALFKGAVALALDSSEMHENVLLVVVAGDEPVPLGGVEPLDSSRKGEEAGLSESDGVLEAHGGSLGGSGSDSSESEHPNRAGRKYYNLTLICSLIRMKRDG